MDIILKMSEIVKKVKLKSEFVKEVSKVDSSFMVMCTYNVYIQAHIY